ncbi:flippase [Halopenitus persicus]|uniref:Membrane protein involved in the export of O-antigen and teichoic acid n=1 Tax=Halopenitus persicus TaxID=1048396 RepID=A0A1H3J045_9EURY|nr:flippase [Halopenitus persicus]SDY32929.1 Membrane protein involved in the export of O-antigen and teichoic acid [Halopenitus persicus]
MTSRLAKNAFILSVGSVIGSLSAFAFKTLIAQSFGPEQFGLFSLALMTVTISAGVAGVGLPTGVTTFISRYRAVDDRAHIKGTASSGLLIGGVISVLVAGGLFLLAPAIATHIFQNSRLIRPIRILAFAIPGIVIVDLVVAIAMGFERAEYSVLIRQLGRRGSLIILAALVILFGGVFVDLLYVYVVSTWIAVAMGGMLIFRLLDLSRSGISSPSKSLLTFSVPLLFNNVTGTISNWIDTFLVGILITAEAVGEYQTAFLLGTNILIITGAVSASFLPEVASLLEEGDRAESTRRYRTAVKWTVIISFAPAVYLITFPELSLRMLFGEAFGRGSTALIIIVIGNMIAVVSGPATETVKSQGHTRFIFATNAIALGANIVINLLAIPRYGIAGAALGTAVATLIANGSHWVAMRRWCGVTPSLSALWFIPPVAILSALASWSVVSHVDSVLLFLGHIALFSGIYVISLVVIDIATGNRLGFISYLDEYIGRF